MNRVQEPDTLAGFLPGHNTYLVTASGWARSGKGTSMQHLKSRLELAGMSVGLIDQGVKFRAMAVLAMRDGQPLDDEQLLDEYVRSETLQSDMITLLGDVASMDDKTKDSLLYTPVVGRASAKVGRTKSAHETVSKLLRTEVINAAEDDTDVVLIDGRSVESYAQEYDEEGIAIHAFGWFYKCDPVIAARRSLKIFGSFDTLTPDQKHMLLDEALKISDRNKSDTLRTVRPLREPVRAYRLDFGEYFSEGADIPYKRAGDMLRYRMGLVDTSYTEHPLEMAYPITEISTRALLLRGAPIPREAIGHKLVGAYAA